MVNQTSAPSAAKQETPRNDRFVFVHGIAGWGSYDFVYRLMPYWGMFGGDLMRHLNRSGFQVFAASVDPNGSAWDRACELFAQLTGSVVDYGEAHSNANGHKRFGKDYRGRALVPAFGAADKLHLLGHSFGGTTIRMLAHLLEQGSDAERAATSQDSISPLFTGGKGDWICSLTTLATPLNGTTAYYDKSGEEMRMGPPLQRIMTTVMEVVARKKTADRIDSDHAEYDMDLDRAQALNAQMQTQDNLYYFSFPCAVTARQSDGTHRVKKEAAEVMFRATADRIGILRGATAGGIVYGDDWLENDGLVNTVSAKAPFGAPQKDFDENDIPKGVWNVMPVTVGDHMALEGGLFHVRDVRSLYKEHLTRLINLE